MCAEIETPTAPAARRNAFLLEFWEFLVASVRKRVSDPDAAADVAQDVAVRVLERADGFDPDRDPGLRVETAKGWIAWHVRGAVANARKARAGAGRVQSLNGDPRNDNEPHDPRDYRSAEMTAGRAERVALVRRALDRLAPPDREFVVRRYGHGETAAEIRAAGVRDVDRRAARVPALCRAALAAVGLGDDGPPFDRAAWVTFDEAAAMLGVDAGTLKQRRGAGGWRTGCRR